MAKGSRGGKRANANKVDYKPVKYGQITKFEAGKIYRANKEGNIKALPETVRTMYNETEYSFRMAGDRYNNNRAGYDRIYSAVNHIVNKDYKKAQKEIDKWEKSNIELAGKKSPFYKYKK